MFGLSELAVILVVVIVVLAVKKGPDLARTAGRSARVLKSEARAAQETEGAARHGGSRESAESGHEGPTAPRVIRGETVTRSGPARTDPARPAAGPAADRGPAAGPRD